MSGYRPITDVWILARPKVKYYGAYPNGFLERGIVLLGVRPRIDMVLHVCGGRVKDYPNKRCLGAGTRTLDLDPLTGPDYCQDAREPLPKTPSMHEWDGIFIDRPYTEIDADRYAPGRAALPSATQLLRNALQSVKVGGRVGVLDYLLPRPPSTGARFLACVGVVVGYDNRMRCFSVFERETA